MIAAARDKPEPADTHHIRLCNVCGCNHPGRFYQQPDDQWVFVCDQCMIGSRRDTVLDTVLDLVSQVACITAGILTAATILRALDFHQ